MGRTLVAAALLLVATLALGASPAARAAEAERELVIGTYVDPPFAMKTARGDWHGIAIALWREIARIESFRFRFVEYDLEELFAAVEAGRVDVAVGPLLITAARERRVDMTSPFMHVSLAIATRPAEAGDWLAAIASAATGTILKASLGLVAAMVVFALIVWLIERRRNPDHFGGERMKGIGDAVWWSASTMTTVGYGDRTPITLWGRTAGIVWMIISIVLVSTFIATVSSTLTLVRLQPRIHSVHDLARARVGVVEGSGAAEFVAAMHVAASGFTDVETAMAALVAGEIDAVVEEAPVLHYLASTEYEGRVTVVPQPFSRGFVAFALPREAPLRRRINVAMLEVLDDQAWRELVRKFLGT